MLQPKVNNVGVTLPCFLPLLPCIPLSLCQLLSVECKWDNKHHGLEAAGGKSMNSVRNFVLLHCSMLTTRGIVNKVFSNNVLWMHYLHVYSQ